MPRARRVWWLASALAAIAAGALSYPQWSRGFQLQPNELEVTAAPHGGKSVSVFWQGPGGAERPAAELPLQHPGATQSWNIRITYLARKNAASEGSEVWLLKVAAPEILDWREFAPPPGWQQRPSNFGALRNALAAWGGVPATVEIQRTGGTLSLQFQRHKEGGLVEVTVNSESRVVDLYSRQIGVEALTWQPDPAQAGSATEVLRTRIAHPASRFRLLRLAAEPADRVDILSVKLDGVPLQRLSAGVFSAPGSYWTAPAMATIAALLTSIAMAALLLLLALAWASGCQPDVAPRGRGCFGHRH